MSLHVDAAAHARTIDALSEKVELPQSADLDRKKRIKEISDELQTARIDILRNIRPPISPTDAAGLETFMTSVADLLSLLSSLESFSDLPVSSPGLAVEAYRLRDQAGPYKTLAGHFFNKGVQASRRERTSDVVDTEVEVISRRASDLKDNIVEYLDKVREALQPSIRL